MNNENNNPTIKIGDTEYELVFTVKAAKEILNKFGELEEIEKSFSDYSNLSKLVDTISWLVLLLANQGILQYNFYHRDEPKRLLTEEEVELFCDVDALISFENAIVDSIVQGINRNVAGNEDIKNQEGE